MPKDKTPSVPAPEGDSSIVKGLRFIEASIPGVIHVIEEVHAKYAFGDRIAPAATLKQEGTDKARVVDHATLAKDYVAAP